MLSLVELRSRFAFEDMEAAGDRLALSVRIGPSPRHRRLSYRELAEAATSRAGALQQLGCSPGQRVALLLPHSAELVTNFFSAIYAGLIPSIIAWPTVKMDTEKYRRNLIAIVSALRADWLLSEPAMVAELGDVVGGAGVIQVADVVDGTPCRPSVRNEGTAFIQFSGGTTGTQKSVPISFELLHDQLVSYASALELSPADRIISWLPLYHDMGLVACLLMPFVFRLPLIMFAPMEWVMDPSPFLEAMGQEMATLCWLPNFAFSFLASRVQPTNRLDFSSVRALINCSEPVRAESMDAFLGRFASRGLRPEALHTCYAMAESTFAITQTTERAPPKRILVSKSAFGRGQIEPSSSGERILVSCGTPIPATDVKVVDDGGDICAEGTIGEIRVRGSSVMDGYLDARANLNSGRPVFVDGWYCTGDLGALREGHLYVTGRRKDLIIVGGVNVYPEDIEAAASELHGIHAGRAVAMGLLDERLGTERLVVVAEAEGAIEATDREKLELAVRAAAVAVSGIAPHKVFVVPPKWIVKSTAGKISRVETKDRVLARWDDLIAGLEMTKNAEA